MSADVYARLHGVAIEERRTKHSQARPFGKIVIDAIRAHASRLQTAWAPATDTDASDDLFVLDEPTAVPKRRRHASPPKTVPLSGINPENATRLDAYVQQWGAGTRSALVEQALRFEFDDIEQQPGE